MAYDELGNFIASGFAGPEAISTFADTFGNVADLAIDEEERRRREEEERRRQAMETPQGEIAPVKPDEVVHKTQTVTRADGSQTHTTTQEVPAAAPAAQPTFAENMRNNIQGYVNQERRNLGMQPVAPEGTQPQAQPQQRQPGFAERVLNAVIPSAQAGELPPQQRQQTPVAEAIPVAPQPQPQFRNLANSAGPDVAYQPPAPEPVREAGAGRGFVNPPRVNAPVAPDEEGQPGRQLVNNNPGNIMFGDYAKRMGATGARPNGTAIFPDQAAGEAAQHNLLGSSGYANLSIKDIPKRWAPAGHGNNDPVAYGNTLQQMTGFDDATMGKKYNELSPGEQAAYRQAMTRIEHGSASSGNMPNANIAEFQSAVNARQPGALGNFGPNRDGVDGTMGQRTQEAIAANPDLAEKYGLKSSGAKVEAEKSPAQLGIERYQAAQDDPIGLMALRTDETQPKWIRERAANRLTDFLVNERNQAQGTAKAQEMIANGDTNNIGKTLATTPKNAEGSAIKAALLNFIGAHKAAEEEINRWGGYGQKSKAVLDADGNASLIDFDSQGRPLSGLKADGTPMNQSELIKAAANASMADQTKTLQTQAHHSAASTMDAMRKENRERTSRNLPALYSEDQIQQKGREVYDQTMRVSRGGTALANRSSLTGGTTTPTETPKTETPKTETPKTETPKTETPKAEVTEYTTHDGKPSMVFSDWKKQRVGEDTKSWGKRLEIRPEDVEQAAQALAKGQMKPSELTGRQNDFRRVAVERALEINPKYSPQTYDTTQAVLKRYTSGKDHDTLVNTGTAVNHLMQYKDIAAQTPGNTNVSSWNTFYQNLQKYGNAPEIKSKEQMAGFVAGELVKAASGGQGSMTERIHQEQQLMKANTPAEVQMVIDNAIKLAHGRYSSMRSAFKGATGRSDKEFADLVGMPDEARKAFDKIDASHAIKDQGSAAEKWARANPDDPRAKEILKRLGKQ